MPGILRLTLVSTLIAASLAGVAWAATAAIPEKHPTAVVQGVPALPGDKKTLADELSKRSSVRYKVLVAEDVGAEDKTAYLDRVAEAWKDPVPTLCSWSSSPAPTMTSASSWALTSGSKT